MKKRQDWEREQRLRAEQLKKLHLMIQDNPERALKVIKSWLVPGKS